MDLPIGLDDAERVGDSVRYDGCRETDNSLSDEFFHQVLRLPEMRGEKVVLVTRPDRLFSFVMCHSRKRNRTYDEEPRIVSNESGCGRSESTIPQAPDPARFDASLQEVQSVSAFGLQRGLKRVYGCQNHAESCCGEGGEDCLYKYGETSEECIRLE